MIKSEHTILWLAAPLVLVLANSGCATRGYARRQVAPVSAKVASLEVQAAQTNEKIATVSEKHDSDMSQVNERISTTDQRVAQIAADTRTAQGTAARAAQQAEANSSKMAETSASVTALSSGVENALNYQLVEKADVTFATNKSALGPQEKAALSEIASKAAAMPRSLVELAGFADPVGSSTYNLALSRRRAESVQRYLVMQNVPLRAIHIVGLGEEAPPAGSEADTSMVGPQPTRAELNKVARRVQIRLYGAGDLQGTASRSQK